MPITKATFNKATKPIDQRIIELLQSNPDKAYDILEIVSKCENMDPNNQLSLFTAMMIHQEKYLVKLKELIQNGTIQKGEIGGGTYYGIK